MNKYEFTVVYVPDEANRKEGINAVEALLESKNVKVLNRKEWGLKTLAYEIKKLDRGFYVFYELEMDGKEIALLERELSLNSNVLRHLFVKEVYHKVKRRPFTSSSNETSSEDADEETVKES